MWDLWKVPILIVDSQQYLIDVYTWPVLHINLFTLNTILVNVLTISGQYPLLWRDIFLSIFFGHLYMLKVLIYLNNKLLSLIIPSHTIVAGYYGFTLDVHPSIFCSQMITWVNIMDFHQTWYVYWLILWRSCLGLLMGNFCQILKELSAWGTPIFLFPDDNLCKCKGILKKLGTCIDIKEIGFGIANGQILSECLTELSVRDMIMAGYYSLTFLFESVLKLLIC